MKRDGLVQVLDFLNLLREHGVDYRLDQQAPDGIMVVFSLYGIRAEVTFTADEFQYSLFKGDESVHTDQNALISLIKERSA